MRDKNKDTPEALRSIEVAFANWRQGNHRGKIPLGLKKLAIAAVEAGHKASAVALAVGVSKQMMSTWRKGQQFTAPTEVKHEDKAVEAKAPTELKVFENDAASQLAVEPALRISFRSGATVEVPASYFTAQLVAALNGGAV